MCFCLLFEQTGFAQVAGALDISGHLSAFRNSFIQDKFRPLHLRSLGYDNIQNNFRLLLDKGDLKNPKKPELETTTKTLLSYFFVGITLPNDTFWVNLRPDSENNIIDPDLATTDVGKILLEADLQLKKDTAKFTSPETPEGKEYWDKLYQKAGELLGYENITIPTLTRPWIVPGEIIIRETKDNAYIYKATLKVMLEQDYLKDSATYKFDDPRLKTLNEYSSQLIRDLIIPKLTKEINVSQRYAPLRQVYYSLILAQWFKSRFYGKGGLYSWLIDRRGLQGLTSKISWSKTTYFKAYQKSFKNGEYNIQQPVYTPYGQTIRSYFSGGFVCNVPIPAIPTPGVASERIDGPTKVIAISGDAEHNPLPRTENIVGALAVGGNTMDPSETKVTITEEASLPSGLPAGGPQTNASSVSPKPHFGHSGNQVDKQFIEAQLAIQNGNLAEAQKEVQEAIRLLREENFDKLDTSGFPVADMVNQTEVAIWVLEQLQTNNLANNEALELLKQLKAGINGLELKQTLGYRSDLTPGISEKTEHKRWRWIPLNRITFLMINPFIGPTLWVFIIISLLTNDLADASLSQIALYSNFLFIFLTEISFWAFRLIFYNNMPTPVKKGFVNTYSFFHKIIQITTVSFLFLGILNITGIAAVINPQLIFKTDFNYWFSIVEGIQHTIYKLASGRHDSLLGFGGYTMRNPKAPIGGAIGVQLKKDRYRLQVEKKKDKDESNKPPTAGGQVASNPVVPDGVNADPTKNVSGEENLGGVDFRALPIINQQINMGMLKLSPADLNRLSNINLDSEWLQIQSMVNAGIIPSNERIKEYVLASCLRYNLGNQMNKVLGCIADIMRMEEDRVVDADVELKDMLVLIEAGKPETELQCGLSQIKISPQEPKPIATP